MQFGENLTFRREILSPSAGSRFKPSKKLFFDHEDGGSTFLQNVRLSPIYTGVSHLEKLESDNETE
jgi:hypothetical protein